MAVQLLSHPVFTNNLLSQERSQLRLVLLPQIITRLNDHEVVKESSSPVPLAETVMCLHLLMSTITAVFHNTVVLKLWEGRPGNDVFIIQKVKFRNSLR